MVRLADEAVHIQWEFGSTCCIPCTRNDTRLVPLIGAALRSHVVPLKHCLSAREIALGQAKNTTAKVFSQVLKLLQERRNLRKSDKSNSNNQTMLSFTDYQDNPRLEVPNRDQKNVRRPSTNRMQVPFSLLQCTIEIVNTNEVCKHT